jgi:chromosome partitioning protein
MTHILAVANQKGGVGKTTTTVNLAAALAQIGRRVLLVDLDAQANATTGLGVSKHDAEPSLYEVLLEQCHAKEALLSILNFSLLPANGDLTAAEVELRQSKTKETSALALKRALEPLHVDFDHILIDCPPALSMLTLNALSAADGVLIPMQCEYYALEGLSALRDTLQKVKAALNPNLVIDGLVRTMFDNRNNLAQQVSEQLKQHFPKELLETVIPRNIRLAEAPSHGLPVNHYDPASRGAEAYQALALELLRRWFVLSPTPPKPLKKART